MSRQRILLFAPHFAEYSLRLATGLAARAEVLLVVDGKNLAAECEDALVRDARAAGVRIIAYRYTSTLARALWFFVIMARAVLFRMDVVHLQEQADKSTARLIKALSRLAPVVLTVHDPQPHSGVDAERARQTAGYRATMRSLARVYHVHGDYCARLMRSTLDAQDTRPIVSTAHGVILEPTPERLASPEPNRVLFFGRMEAYKGVDVLLDAVDHLAAKGAPVHLVVAGRGPELDRLGDRLRNTPGVELKASFLTPAEAIHEFQTSSAVIAPYRDATQSGVVAAAIANGRPIIASRVGGLIDAVRDDVEGLLVPAGDAEALAEAIARITSDQDLRDRLAANAAASARTLFSWDAVAAKLIDAYEGLDVRGTKA